MTTTLAIHRERKTHTRREMHPVLWETCLVHTKVVGWRIRFRRTGTARCKAPAQTQTFTTPSLFGALRQLIREGRMWHGKTFFLEIVAADPIGHTDYETLDD